MSSFLTKRQLAQAGCEDIALEIVHRHTPNLRAVLAVARVLFYLSLPYRNNGEARRAHCGYAQARRATGNVLATA